MTNDGTFQAADSALGYIYQIKYALFAALKQEPDKISLETDDDVVLEKDTGKQLLQIKHSTDPKSITISSPQIWKSLRVWISAIQSGDISPVNTKFFLITRGYVDGFAFAQCLRPHGERNPGEAIKIARQYAENNSNKSLKAAVSTFLSCEESLIDELFSNIYLVGSSSTIDDIDKSILSHLELVVRPEHAEDFFNQIEGWWLSRVLETFQSREKYISVSEIKAQIRNAAENFRAGNLPVIYSNAYLDDDSKLTFFDRQFVEQLRRIEVSPRRIELAIDDYYRAFSERMNWVEKGYIRDYDLAGYDENLIDEWAQYKEICREEYGDDVGDEELKAIGKKIFNYFMSEFDRGNLRNVKHGYVMKGSMHMIADELNPRIYWHEYFAKRIQEIA